MFKINKKDKKTIIEDFSSNLKLIRRAMNLSQSELGDLIGVTRQTVSAIERNSYGMTWTAFLACLSICYTNSDASRMVLDLFSEKPIWNEGLLDHFKVKFFEYSSPDFPEIVSDISYGMCKLDFSDNLKIMEIDSGFTRIFGYIQKNVEDVTIYFHELIYGNESRRLCEKIKRKISIEGRAYYEITLVAKNEKKVSVLCYFDKPYPNSSEVNVVFTDITNHKHIQNKLNETQFEFQSVVSNIPDGVAVIEIGDAPKLLFANEGFYKIIGMNQNEYVQSTGNVIGSFITPQHQHFIKSLTKKEFSEDVVTKWNVQLKRNDGSVIWASVKGQKFRFSDGNPVYSCVISDISDEVASKELLVQKKDMLMEKQGISDKIINSLSTTDALTGLYNYATFFEKCKQFIATYDGERCYAVIYSDTTGFSNINELYGVETGNKYLKDFADFIKNMGVGVAISTRHGADHFINFVIGDKKSIVDNIAYKYKEFLQQQRDRYPNIDLDIIMGVYFIESYECEASFAFDNAFLAWRECHRTRISPYCVYTPKFREKRRTYSTIGSQLRNAIKDDMIEAFIQPKFSISERNIIGMEALARWRNDNGTYKYPADFVPILEKTHRISQLDFHIYELVMKKMKEWKSKNYMLYPVSVNFSGLSLKEENLVERLLEIADKYDIASSLIEIEITEGAFTSDTADLIEKVREIQKAGFKVSIDDFGIGCQSFEVLMEISADIIKIDKFFIDGMSKSESQRKYLKSMFSFVRTSCGRVVFEGVETESQAEFIKENGFDIAQGYLFDKPMNTKEFEQKYLA